MTREVVKKGGPSSSRLDLLQDPTWYTTQYLKVGLFWLFEPKRNPEPGKHQAESVFRSKLKCGASGDEGGSWE